jgi:hypothetical protein
VTDEILTNKQLRKILKCDTTLITKAVQVQGDEFILKGKMIRRVSARITCSKWGYVIDGDAPPGAEPKPKEHIHGICHGCDIKVTRNRAINLNGTTICTDCHRIAFVDLDPDMRRKLRIL